MTSEMQQRLAALIPAPPADWPVGLAWNVDLRIREYEDNRVEARVNVFGEEPGPWTTVRESDPAYD